MKTPKKIIFISIVLGMISSLIISCKSDDKQQTGLLTLSILEGKIKIGDYVSVELSLSHPDLISKIVVKKSIEGKEVSSYLKELNVKELSFPYTFTEEIIAGDENGILVYSFYGMDENNSVVDAADLVLTVELAQIPLLLKYDWVLASQTIKGEDTATPDLKDDIHRFNSDLTWQVDWGFIFSSAALETLNSYCAWQVTMDGATVKTLSTIHYNVFSPSQALMTHYNVLQLSDRKMILESYQDLSGLGDGYSSNERVLEVYTPVSKTEDFTPYRGQNPGYSHLARPNFLCRGDGTRRRFPRPEQRNSLGSRGRHYSGRPDGCGSAGDFYRTRIPEDQEQQHRHRDGKPGQ